MRVFIAKIFSVLTELTYMVMITFGIKGTLFYLSITLPKEALKWIFSHRNAI